MFSELNVLNNVANTMIRQDKLANKSLIYNIGYQNKVRRQKFFELYYKLTNKKGKEKKKE